MIARLQELSKQQYVSPFQTAVVYAGLDERQLALDWLEKSRQERFNWLPFIKVDPVFKNLRSEAAVCGVVEKSWIELKRTMNLSRRKFLSGTAKSAVAVTLLQVSRAGEHVGPGGGRATGVCAAR